VTTLFVIEAPGKARTLEVILQRLGHEARVQATKGHLFQMPETLENLGIDSAFREYERKPRELAVVQRLRSEAQLADTVYIATDADAEGEVIAWDVAELIRDIHPNPMRVRLTGMDDESVLEALKTASSVEKRDAIPGRTRAIVDRLIGAGFSRGGVAVGRVGTALLGLVERDSPVVRRLRLVAPSKDGGRPWSAETDIVAPLDDLVAGRLASLDLPPLEIKGSFPLKSPPGHTGDIMIRAGDRLDMSPSEVSKSMQRMYEGGRMSYPRAGSRTLSATTARKMAEMLRKAGYRVDGENYAKKGEDDVHDAPYPIGPVDPSKDPEKLGYDEGVRTMVARDLVKSGQKHEEQIPQLRELVEFLARNGFSKDVALAVAKMPWSREVGPRYPGQESWPDSGIVTRRPDVVLLEKAVKAGLGRPSTWANHISTFMSRDLVDSSLNLTAKGIEWRNGSPPELLDPKVSIAIEAACERYSEAMMDDPSREPWELNAERIVGALPERIRDRLVAMVQSEAPRPKIDPILAYGETPDALEEARNRASSMGYRPKSLSDG